MSTKYSNSPALHLRIGKSRLRCLLHRALCLCTIFALLLLYEKGYASLVSLLSPLACYLLWRLQRDPMVGAALYWQQGTWIMDRGGYSKTVSIGRSSTALRWAIYLTWRELPDGAGGCAWLFMDSLPAQQLRGLRVRLTLEH